MPGLVLLEDNFLEADLVEVQPKNNPNNPLRRSLAAVVKAHVDEEPDHLGQVLVVLPPVTFAATAL